MSSATSSDVEMDESRPSQPIIHTTSSSRSSLSKYQSLSNINMDCGVSVQDIRNLTTTYQKLLAQATKEITKLNLEKTKLEKENEKLLGTNVEMAEETRNLIVEKKQWADLEQEILKTNEELAEEVDKLYKSEDRILLERDKMSEKVESLRRETENLRDENTKLAEEKQKQNVVIDKLNQENLRNFGTLEILKKELEMEKSTREKFQLENTFLTSSQKNTADRLHVMEKEMEEQAAILNEEREKLVNVTTWKDQIVEKNKKLTEENEKLLFRTEHLESLVNQEIGDITNILHTIKMIQD